MRCHIKLETGLEMSSGDNEIQSSMEEQSQDTVLGEMEVLIVPHEAAGKRVDLFISANAPDDISRARVQALVRKGLVTINGERPRGTSTKIAVGDVVRYAMPEPEDAIPQPEDIPLEILFEDDDLIVINKPSGMVVHPAPGNWSGTLVNALLHHCKGELSGIGGVKRPGIVHRLDKDTSGVIVVAKSYRTHVDLQEQFADHGRTGPLKRSYQALVWGVPPRMKGTIDTHVGRHPTIRLRRAVIEADRPDAKFARTHYEVLQRVEDHEKPGEALVSLVECTLETGRTHQIRVHMTHIGNPLLGDQEYGKQYFSRIKRLPDAAQEMMQGFKRQALHARTLGFRHPVTGETVSFTAEPPAEMTDLLKAITAG
jgi:23S rRNA pseudouridine1911/1915/1917 synthase